MYEPIDINIKTKMNKNKNNVKLLLFLDVNHSLPLNDEWISNAISLFNNNNNLKILGGYVGIIKDGQTFGELSYKDQRTNKMDKEKHVFHKNIEIIKNVNNIKKNKYNNDRLNIYGAFKSMKDWYLSSFDKKIKQDQWGANQKIIQKNFNKKKKNFTNNNEYDFNDGFDSIRESLMKQYDKEYEKHLKKNFPNMTNIKSFTQTINDIVKKYNECDKIAIKLGSKDKVNDTKCQEYFNYIPPEFHSIPYEANIHEKNSKFIPFMYVSAVRFPLFIRHDWYFDKLLPNLIKYYNIQNNKIISQWLDIEMSLNTLSLGGDVGLYDADGFLFDRYSFKNEIKRNVNIFSKESNLFYDKHRWKNEEWDIWNVTHIYLKNQKKCENIYHNCKLRPRTVNTETSDNPLHSTKLKNSKSILKMHYDAEKLPSKLIKMVKTAKPSF